MKNGKGPTQAPAGLTPRQPGAGDAHSLDRREAALVAVTPNQICGCFAHGGYPLRGQP